MQIATLVTAPATEPATLAEAKAWAKIDTAADDTLITSLIVAARESAERYTKRAFITQTWKLTLDLPCEKGNWFPGTFDLPMNAFDGELTKVIELPNSPIISITSVVTYNTSNTSATYSTDYYTLNAASSRMVLAETAVWPSPLRPAASAEITYTAGYGAAASSVPQAIRTAILMHVQAMYDGRIVCEMPEPCKQLLNQYKVYG